MSILLNGLVLKKKIILESDFESDECINEYHAMVNKKNIETNNIRLERKNASLLNKNLKK